MKTMTKFHHWGPLNTRKNILVITFGKELTVTQPKKTDGRWSWRSDTHACSKARALPTN